MKSELVNMVERLEYLRDNYEGLIGEILATLTIQKNRDELKCDPVVVEKLFKLVDGWKQRFDRL